MDNVLITNDFFNDSLKNLGKTAIFVGSSPGHYRNCERVLLPGRRLSQFGKLREGLRR